MTSSPAPCANRPASPRGRRGFTLVELLIVITIIAILASLVTVAGVGFIGSARVAATRTTIKKIDEAILERVGAVNRWHQRPVSRLQGEWRYRGWETEWYNAGLDVFANAADRDAAKMILSRKGMLREMLPVDVEELKKAYWFWGKYDIDGVVGLSAAEFAKMNAWLEDADPATPVKERLDRPGEVFYYALTNAPVFGAQRVAEDDFKPSEAKDLGPPAAADSVEPDGFLELVDAWESPLRFYRWPTRLVNNYANPGSLDPLDPATWTWGSDAARKVLMPNAPGAAADLAVDPDDRAGYFAGPQPLAYLGKLYTTPAVAFFHDPNTWHAPLVVSAGPDRALGLDEPNTAIPFHPDIKLTGLAAPVAGQTESLFDNISNHNGNGALQ